MRKRASAFMGSNMQQQQMNMGYPQYATQNNNQAGRAGIEGALNENQRRRELSNPPVNKMGSARATRMPSPRNA